MTKPVSSESAIVNASTGNESAVALPASIGRKFAASFGTSGTSCHASNAPRIPASKLMSTLSKTKRRSTLARDRAQRHAERNFAAPAAESNEEQVGDVAAGDEQDKGHGREKRGETRSQIFRHIFRQRLHHRAGFRVDLFGILRAIAVLEQLQSGAGLLLRHARLQASDRAQEGGAAHHALVRETRDDERLGRPDIGVRSRPRDRQRR